MEAISAHVVLDINLTLMHETALVSFIKSGFYNQSTKLFVPGFATHSFFFFFKILMNVSAIMGTVHKHATTPLEAIFVHVNLAMCLMEIM